MANEQNLRSFKPGEIGNKNGRPKGSKNRGTIARATLDLEVDTPEELSKELLEYFPDMSNKLSLEELMTLVMIKKAIDGNVSAYIAIMDSAYGKFKEVPTENGLFENYTAEELEAMVYLPGDDESKTNQNLD